MTMNKNMTFYKTHGFFVILLLKSILFILFYIF